MVGNMRKPHAVVFPIPLQGHINPMMLLAKHLNSAGIRVTFLLTERTLSILQHNNNSKHNNGVAHEDAHDEDNYDNRCVLEGGILPKNNNNHNSNSTVTTNNKHINNKSNPRKDGDGIDNGYDVDDIDDNIKNGNDVEGDSIDNGDDGDGINNHNDVEDDNKKNGNSNIKHNSTDYGVNNPDIKINTVHDGNDDGGYVDACDDDGGYVDACDVDGIPPIEFETLPDSTSSHDHTLPMSSDVLIFLNSVPLLKRKLEEILERLQQKGHPATCIISDSFVPWTQDVANEFGIPRMEFWSSSVTVYAMGYHIPQLISRGYLPVHPGADAEFCIDIIPGLATFRLVDFFYPHAISSPVFDLISMAFSRAKEAQRVLVNSFYDLEKDITDALRAEGVAIDPIGPLLPLQMGSSAIAMRLHRGVVPGDKIMSTSLYADDDDCLAWLDTQAESSVIYVSFGSMACISKEETEELLLGLESSQQPYLLVLRPGMVTGGCTQTAGGKGRICGWAPQIHVLGHPAVGGFLTHCGWNSIMEGMYMGVPMIGCARESEQHTNMKCLRDEWKVAIGLADHHLCEGRRKEATKKVEMKKELVERAVKALMQEEEGVALRTRMRGLQEAAKRAAHHASSSLPLLIHHIKHGKN